MLIVLEGCDAVGKQTQSNRLAARLRAHGRATEVISFPRYDTPLGQAIKRHLMNEIGVHERPSDAIMENHPSGLRGVDCTRAPEDPLIFQCMMLADKQEAAAGMDRFMYKGGVVVCDRWVASSYAYGGSDDLSHQWLVNIQARLPQADLSILLELSEEETKRRRPALRDRYEKDREKQAKVRERYAALWDGELLPGKLVRVDAHGSPEEVHERIWRHTGDLLGLRRGP